MCSPRRNFCTVKVIADNGLYGLGDATLNGREQAVAAYPIEHVVPLMAGHLLEGIEVPMVGEKYTDLAMSNGSSARKTVPIAELDSSKPILFWKAKAFGIPTRLDYNCQGLSSQYVDPLAGSEIILTWTKDKC
jgi:hypothetical protein